MNIQKQPIHVIRSKGNTALLEQTPDIVRGKAEYNVKMKRRMFAARKFEKKTGAHVSTA